MKIVYLKTNDTDPPEGENWILIEKENDGTWYGTGFGIRDKEQKIYISRSESDASLDTAISAACSWAEKNDVGIIYVRQ